MSGIARDCAETFGGIWRNMASTKLTTRISAAKCLVHGEISVHITGETNPKTQKGQENDQTSQKGQQNQKLWEKVNKIRKVGKAVNKIVQLAKKKTF